LPHAGLDKKAEGVTKQSDQKSSAPDFLAVVVKESGASR